MPTSEFEIAVIADKCDLLFPSFSLHHTSHRYRSVGSVATFAGSAADLRRTVPVGNRFEILAAPITARLLMQSRDLLLTSHLSISGWQPELVKPLQ